VFITLEGSDGAGKTTQATLLVERLREDERQVVAVREPGGTELGDAVRGLLLNRQGDEIDPRSEALLFAACRAQLVRRVIRPALERGAIVVADRFADSTLAYQGCGRGLPQSDLESLIRFATGGLAPDLTILVDVPADVGIARRMGDKPENWTRFETEDRAFHERVRQSFRDLAAREPSRWVVVNGVQETEAVASEVWDAVVTRLGSSGR
jgi:dTMP kinase